MSRRKPPLLPGWEMPPANLYAVYLPTRHLAPKVRAFVDFLVTKFNGAGDD